MDKDSAIRYYKDVVTDLIHNADFLAVLSEGNWCEWEFRQKKVLENDFSYLTICSGEDRTIIYDETIGWVVKVGHSRNHKICEKEVLNYHDAEEWCVDGFFARACLFDFSYRGAHWTFELMEAANVDAIDLLDYIESKVNVDELTDCCVEEIHDSRLDEDLCFSHENTLEIMEAIYGDDFCRAEEFIDRNEINDLHGGNIGLVNGCLVFIDYAGYTGNCD